MKKTITYSRNPDWADWENVLLVNDYLDMLVKELRGIAFVKARHTEKVLEQLKDAERSKKSIEDKRMNVSAVMMKFGLPYIAGYKPRDHYQRESLERIVAQQVASRSDVSQAIEFWMSHLISKFPTARDFSRRLKKPPKMKSLESPVIDVTSIVKRNYLEEEQRNAIVGEQGELFALEFERWRLRSSGEKELADKVIWASKEIGDGLGYDIASKTVSGENLFIEVKTTTQGKYTPFFITPKELRFSTDNASNFSLYRVFNLTRKPQLFIKDGSVSDYTKTSPVLYKAWITG
jgi:hypothetical protein